MQRLIEQLSSFGSFHFRNSVPSFLTSVLCMSRPGLDCMIADVTGAVTAQPYESHLEVSQRFPGLSGKLLIDAITRATPSQ